MYEQLAEIPVPTAAQFISKGAPGQDVVQITYSVRDHVSKTKRTMVKSLVYSYNGLLASATPLQDTDIVGQIVSPSGTKRAVLRSVKNGTGSTSRFVEIWTDDLLQTSLDVSDYHHDFYTDEYISSLSFAPSESAILYTAEAKAPGTEDVFQLFRFNPDFGEGLSGKKRPAIFFFRWDVSNGASKSSPSLVQLKTREDVRFGQAIFSSSSDKIIYATGYEFTSDGRILGVKGCFNRPSGIWQLRLSSIPTKEAPPEVTSKKISFADHSCRSPRIIVHEGRSFLVWFGADVGGAHIACNRMYQHEITSDDSKELGVPDEAPFVGIIDTPESDGFPGLYPAYTLPKSASIQVSGSSQTYILLHSQWGSRTTVLRVSPIDESVKDLTPAGDDLCSWSVLTTNGSDSVICSRSSPCIPYEIMLGKFNPHGAVTWTLLEKPQLPRSVSKALSVVRTSIIPIPERGLVETILVRAFGIIDDGTKPPCILVPHGGPHAPSTTAFSATTTALALEGYTLSFPNYTGSPGYGEQFIQDLIGRCGALDVQDCIASARHLIKLGISETGPGKQFIMGGSHGGFLGAHLIGQFPDFFSAVALRNPVISVGEISTTDIPDWYFAEFGFKYPISAISNDDEDQQSTFQPPSHPPRPPLITGETFSKLRLASPIAYLDFIRAPVLLLIGAADRRVAPTHGAEFYHALKGRYAAEGVDVESVRKKVEMLIFEGESHPLDGVEAAQVNFEATKEWFLRARD